MESDVISTLERVHIYLSAGIFNMRNEAIATQSSGADLQHRIIFYTIIKADPSTYT